jgi:UDP-N-acetylglucosamine:LPS N-acetylglucosamine transferase
MSGSGTVLLISSSGGVLLELLALRPWWSRHEVAWAVVNAADTEALLAGSRVSWLPELAASNPLKLLPALLRARRILRDVRPELIVSAGSGPAIPFFILAAARGIPAFWISTLNVSGKPGVSARLCARLASRVLVQRPVQREMHPNAVVIGELY